MQNLQQTDEDYYVTTTQILNLARKVGPLFKSSEVDTKRQILNTVLCPSQKKKRAKNIEKV